MSGTTCLYVLVLAALLSAGQDAPAASQGYPAQFAASPPAETQPAAPPAAAQPQAASSAAGPPASQPGPDAAGTAQLEWVFLYIMSYDNDLAHCTEPITRELLAGLSQARCAAAILSDRPGPEGLYFVELRPGARQETRLDTDDITAPDVLADFLSTAVRRLPARRYVVVFLNHGGRLDEMCFDQQVRQDRRHAPRAMSARATGRVLKQWRDGLPGDTVVPLLFLQQCGRGSIENLYTFAGVADYLMASQTIVGACNTYYTETVRLAAESETPPDGAHLAHRIMETDRHYTSYVLVRDAALRELPRRLDRFVAAVELRETHPLAGVAPCFQYQLETNFDLLQVTRFAAARGGPRAEAAATELADWVRTELIAEHRVRRPTRYSGNWCGLSTHVPLDAEALRPYRDFTLYRDSRWAELITRLAPDVERPR